MLDCRIVQPGILCQTVEQFNLVCYVRLQNSPTRYFMLDCRIVQPSISCQTVEQFNQVYYVRLQNSSTRYIMLDCRIVQPGILCQTVYFICLVYTFTFSKPFDGRFTQSEQQQLGGDIIQQILKRFERHLSLHLSVKFDCCFFFGI